MSNLNEILKNIANIELANADEAIRIKRDYNKKLDSLHKKLLSNVNLLLNEVQNNYIKITDNYGNVCISNCENASVDNEIATIIFNGKNIVQNFEGFIFGTLKGCSGIKYQISNIHNIEIITRNEAEKYYKEINLVNLVLSK